MDTAADFGIPAGEDNPNLADEPAPRPQGPGDRGRPGEAAGNVWWSEWANTEQRLQTMRPSDLPRHTDLQEAASRRDLAEVASAGVSMTGMEYRSTSDGRSTSGFGDWSDRLDITAAAVELDRQTSVGHYIPERVQYCRKNR